MEKLRIAIIGQGRSGRNIHGAFFKTEANIYCQVVAVVELDPERRKRAEEEYPGCVAYEDYRELFARDDLDLVVNASFSHYHYPITKDLLAHGLNVVVEKPMGRTYFECCDLIKTAKDHGATLAVFQQSLFAPYYAVPKAVVDSGKIGRIKQVTIRFNGFSRRWDWQTMQSYLGGSVYNTGPHPIGFGLDILGFDPETRVAFSKLDLGLTSGDAEDYAKIILTAPGKPVVDIEISSMDAYSNFNLKFQGTLGTLQTTTKGYTMKYMIPGENPEQPLRSQPLKNEMGLPIYCGETLVTHEESQEYEGSAFDVGTRKFYEMVYHKLRNDVPMAITPEMAAQVINVIETVHGQNPLPVKF